MKRSPSKPEPNPQKNQEECSKLEIERLQSTDFHRYRKSNHQLILKSRYFISLEYTNKYTIDFYIYINTNTWDVLFIFKVMHNSQRVRIDSKSQIYLIQNSLRIWKQRIPLGKLRITPEGITFYIEQNPHLISASTVRQRVLNEILKSYQPIYNLLSLANLIEQPPTYYNPSETEKLFEIARRFANEDIDQVLSACIDNPEENRLSQNEKSFFKYHIENMKKKYVPDLSQTLSSSYKQVWKKPKNNVCAQKLNTAYLQNGGNIHILLCSYWGKYYKFFSSAFNLKAFNLEQLQGPNEEQEKDLLIKNNFRDHIISKLRVLSQLINLLFFLHKLGLVLANFELRNFLLYGFSKTFENKHQVDLILIDATAIQQIGQKIDESENQYVTRQLPDQIYSRKSDVFSFGVFSYILLFGQSPFRNKKISSKQEFEKSLRIIPERFSDIIYKGFGSALLKIITSCIQYRPQDRTGLIWLFAAIKTLIKDVNNTYKF